MPEGAVLMYQWSCNDTAIDLDAATLQTNELRLMPYSFPAGTAVKLNITAWLSSSPDVNTTASMLLEIRQAADVYARIAGGSFRTL